MTDADLFNKAVECAQSVAYWRQRAADAGQREQVGTPAGPFNLTRRQCLARVRYGQARIVDLAILAERRAADAAKHLRNVQ
jgi:hypothetical protein